MEWLKNLSNAIEYIEDNLDKEISYDEAACIACCSTYYFQRLFSYAAGISPSEYIRRRRMSQAAFELQRTDKKVLNVALKYGYTSPTSFNRAFQSVHGITPAAAKNKGSILNAYFLFPFMARRKEQRKNVLKKAAVVFLSYVLAYLVCEAVSIPGWLRMIILILLLVSAHRILGIEKNSVFLLGVLFFGIKDMCRLITESLYYIFNMKFLQGVYNESTIYRNAAVGYSAVMVLRFGLLFIMLLFISNRLRKEALELHAKELCYLCLIPLTSIMFGNIIFRLFFTVKENVFFHLYEQYPVFIGLVPMTSVLFYAGIVITIMSYQEMIRLQAEKNRYFVEEQQLLAIWERMKEVEQFYDGIRRMKHEMKNHLTNIKRLAESGSYEEMEKYIARMDESMDVFEITVKTGNAVTDMMRMILGLS